MSEMRFPVPLQAAVVLPDQDMKISASLVPDDVFPSDVEALLNRFDPTGYGEVIIIRGPVGIGKTMLARKIYNWSQGRSFSCVVCSEDPWHVVDGVRVWTAAEEANAENYAQGRYLLAMASRVNVVVVDMDSSHDYTWYANHYDTTFYRRHIIEFNCPDPIRAGAVSGSVERWVEYRQEHREYEATRDEDAIVIEAEWLQFPCAGQ